MVKTVHTGASEHPRFPLSLKVFLNLCQSPFLPAPPPATDDEIAKALESGDASAYRVPLSMSDLREDCDKCTVENSVYFKHISGKQMHCH